MWYSDSFRVRIRELWPKVVEEKFILELGSLLEAERSFWKGVRDQAHKNSCKYLYSISVYMTRKKYKYSL